ncbi:uncharacterized protein LOC142223585 [Haematobia irritans]|uniref:uncharacterized protein LOC142223585 n=1 Tax=Haematobia irritans TaxID=7368 RepID=UPI003F4FCC27
MLRNLWTSQSYTPLNIRILLVRTYILPTLLYGAEIFAGCEANSKKKLQTTFNNAIRYIFGLRKFDHISSFSLQVLKMPWEKYLEYKSLIFLHKIIYTRNPSYLYNRLQFARSCKGKNIIQISYRRISSQNFFLIRSIRLWNHLPSLIQTISNAQCFKNKLFLHLTQEI